MPNTKRVEVDFNATAIGGLSLNTIGTRRDLERQNIQLEEGLFLNVYQNDPSNDYPDDEIQA